MIQVKNLTKYYTNEPAVEDLSFELKHGEIVGLLGLNGSGKTTTIRLLSGFLIPTSGEIFLEGTSLDNPIEAKKKIGYLPETPPLYEDMNVESYLEFVSRIKGITGERSEEEVTRVIEITNLKEVREEIIAHLSLGFRKRVGIAQALIGNPPLIILDEPVSGLDPKQVVDMRHLLRSLAGKHTVLLSSHILNEIYKTCDRFIFLRQGKIVFNYTLKKLESEMDKLSHFEVNLKGKSREETESFLSTLIENSNLNYIEESMGGHSFRIDSQDSTIAIEKLIKNLPGNGFSFQMLKKQEVTLEQIFLKRLASD